MIKIIILNNKTCQLETEDKKVISKIKNSLKFKQEGYEFSLAAKMGWDGYVYLLTTKNKFNYPLLTRVKTVLEENNFEYEIQDKRIKSAPIQPIDISKRLAEIKLVPRDYQLNAAEQVKHHDVGILRLATAAGKSVISCLICANIPKPTLILVIGIDLLYQFKSLYEKVFPDQKIGIAGDGICDLVPGGINIMTVWTAARALKINKKDIATDDNDIQDENFSENNTLKVTNIIETSKLIQIDECHVSGCASIKSILKKTNYENLYGLSGTPFKNGEDSLEIINLLGEKIVDISASFLIEKKVLPQPLIKFINVPPSFGHGKTYPEVYRTHIVDNDIRNNMIVQQTKDLVKKGYKTLVLFKTIDHGKILLKELTASGMRAGLISGKDKIEKRDKAKNDLISGKIDIIIASVIFDIGIDLPILSGMVLAGSGKGYVKANQRIGRLLRPYPGKVNVAIVDFYDNVRYLKKHSTKRLDIYKQEDGFKLILPKNLK